MEYFGSTGKLTKILSDKRLRTKKFGKVKAQKIRERLEEIGFAYNLAEISHVPPARLHRLQGEKQMLFAVDVGANWRMLLEGYDKHDVRSIKEDEIVTIVVDSIEDYH